MQNLLVLGAGQSATYLIRYLLDNAHEHGWFVTVGDRDAELATRAVGGHPSGDAVALVLRPQGPTPHIFKEGTA